MPLGLQILVVWMAVVALFGLGTLAWALYSGQLDDMEDAKFIPFREREPEGWPDRGASAKGGVGRA